MDSFSSSAEVVMERKIEFEKEPEPTNTGLIEEVYEINKCAQWINDNDYKKVCLQFPDSLLIDSVEIYLLLEKQTKAQIFILGDTSYGSCCVDEVAAQHVDTDCIIHFGHACLTPTERLPVLYIFEKLPIDTNHFITSFRNQFKNNEQNLLLLYDVGYSHCLDQIENELNIQYKNLVISQLCTVKEERNDDISYSFGRKYSISPGCDLKDYHIIYIGTDSRTFNNFLLDFNDQVTFYIYDPSKSSAEMKLFEASQSRFLMRRLYLIEKIRDSQTIGILVGTLGAHGYLDCVKRLKELCKIKRRKSYIVAVGKPNVPKLANFPEIEVFVHVSCPENAIYDSKEYLRPIVTPFDFELACRKSSEANSTIVNKYITDYHHLLPGGSTFKELTSVEQDEEGEISLITGEIRNLSNSTSNDNLSVAVKTDGTLATIVNSSGSQFLSQRSWVGLTNISGTSEIKLAVKGLSGIAYGYENESETMEKNTEIRRLPDT